jgi:hypothetical protein
MHPYEQVIGYLAILSRDRGRRRLAEYLHAAAWTYIVAMIARCFEAQLEYADSGSVRAETIERVILASNTLPRGYLAGRLHKELAQYERPEGGRSPGPLVLLPFNYC